MSVDISKKLIRTYSKKSTDEFLLTLIKKGLLDRRFIAPHSREFSRVFHEQLRAYADLGYWPDVHNPITFNEKILNRMLTGENRLYTTATDKIASREYVSKSIGSEFLPELYYVTDDPETIPFESLPNSYVVKSTFGSGQLRLVNDANGVSKQELIHDCNQWLSKDYYFEKAVLSGHYNFDYDNIFPKILIEEQLVGKYQTIPRDYKFYVFHGQVEYVHVDQDRFGDRTMRFFDREWNPQQFTKGRNTLGEVPQKPPEFEQMVEIAETLAQEFEFIRVDLYYTNNDKIIFGELTPNPGAGKSPFEPTKIDREFGELW